MRVQKRKEKNESRKSRKSRRICATAQVIFRKSGIPLVYLNQRTPRQISPCTMPMFGHTGSERLTSPFLRREQTVPYLIRRPMRSVDRSLDFFFPCNVADGRRSPNRSIELIRRCLDTNISIQYTNRWPWLSNGTGN